MRYDLEIPVLDNVELLYIKEGETIPDSLVPLYYLAIDSKDSFPSDFIGVQPYQRPNKIPTSSIQEIQGNGTVVGSNKLLITDKSKYSNQYNAFFQLFYCHVEPVHIKEDNILIYDIYGTKVSKDDYMVEEGVSTTTIYINKTDNPLFMEYTLLNRTNKRLLNLNPIFTELTLEDVGNSQSPTIPPYKYFVDSSQELHLNPIHDGNIFIVYRSDQELYRLPQGNIEDPWHVGILNTTFKKTINGTDYTYSVPEYWNQDFVGYGYFNYVEKKKCRILSDNVVKSQYNIVTDEDKDLDVFVYNYYTNTLRYALTSNTNKIGECYSEGIVFISIKDYNKDGDIYLPFTLEETDAVYATHYTKQDYFIVKALDLSAASLTTGGYFSIFLKPDVEDGEKAVYFAKIGIDDPYDTNIVPQYFKNLDDYNTYCETNNFYQVAILAISANAESQIVKTIDVRDQGGIIKDKESATKQDINVLKLDIINKEISMPTNDAVVAILNTDRLIKDGIFQIDNNLNIDDFTLSYIDKIKNTIKNNLEISTQQILEVDYSTNRLFEIVSLSGENGSIYPEGNLLIKDNEEIEYIITPDEGYEVEEVFVDGVSVGDVLSYTISNPSEDHTIDARFKSSTII